MKQIKFIFTMLVMIAALGFTACGDDEEDEVDVRDQAVGNYTGVVNYYYLNNGVLTTLPDTETTSIPTATVSKEGSQSLLLNLEGDVIKLSKVTAASNGFVFDFDGDINITTEDNEKVTLSGYNGYELQSTNASATKYHGGFINNKLEFYAQGIFEGFSEKIILEFTLTKK